MSPSAGNLLDTALKLPREDRAKLASELIASLDGEAEADAAAAWDAEVQTRIREADAGKARLIDGKSVTAEVSRALKRG